MISVQNHINYKMLYNLPKGEINMQGIYYKTIFRNQMTGETDFEIIPNETCEGLNNGVLSCHGIIGIYQENTPIEINGYLKDGIYETEKCFIPYKTKENVIHILQHVSKELTDNQIEKIANECKGDIFAFFSSEYGLIYTSRVLRREPTDQYVLNIIKKVTKLGLQEELVQELLRYKVPIDRIELLNKKQLTLEALDKDPYLIFLKYEIGIDLADKYAQRKNIKEYSIKRLCGFLMDAMFVLKNNGNSFATMFDVIRTMNYRLEEYGVYKTKVNKSIVNLCVCQLKKYIDYHVIDGKLYLYLNSVWQEECNIINHIYRLSSNKYAYTPACSIKEIEDKFNIKYNKEQLAVFEAIKTSGIKLLIGPPGSGKTATIRGLIEYFGNNGRVKLAATTGMAAKVMKDACKHSTETANMMLNVIPFNETIKGRDLNDPVNAELIIVDEISMIGIQLFSVLVQAVKSGSILLLVGDEDQLQSVEYGNVLHDLISSGCIETYRLKEIIRSSGLICSNAQLINNGCINLQTNADFVIKSFDDEKELVEEIRKININKCQILTPMRKSGICTKTINQFFVKRNNPLEYTYGHKEFHLNDRIIMTKTNYDKGYVNGDIGYVIGCDEKEHMIVRILDKTITLSREDLQNVEFAYAITIHKSQGSEFNEVCVVLPENAKNMMSRRILYTAISRAKKKVTILSMNHAENNAILNNAERGRYTLLSQRLKARFDTKI